MRGNFGKFNWYGPYTIRPLELVGEQVLYLALSNQGTVRLRLSVALQQSYLRER